MDTEFGPLIQKKRYGKLTVSDVETSLTADMIEAASLKVLANFGAPTTFYWGGAGYRLIVNPQYETLPWAYVSRLSKREHAVAKLHTFLFKLDTIKNIDKDHMEEIKSKTIKRLKKARWARYQQKKKVQSSLQEME